MEKFKLKRPIKDAMGKNDISEVSIKSEDELTAYDFYNVSFGSNGDVKIGAMAEAIANVCSLTSEQVALMHPRDYLGLSEIVGKYIA